MKQFFIIFCIAALIGGLYMINHREAEQSNIIVLLGAPGSGKGTQAAKLSKTLALPHISTGDLFRENIRNETPLGVKAKGYMNAGQLVPDELVLDMLFDRVAKDDCKNGYLLDGFPRTIPQAEALVARLNGESLLALDIDVDDAIVTKRISGRLSCKSCGAVYHVDFSPPKAAGVCDACQGELYQRADDTVAVIAERLVQYHQQTEPLIAFFKNRGQLVSVDGDQEPEKITELLLSTIRQKVGK